MVLGPGGPCIALRKTKDGEGTQTTGVCNRTESHIWYVGPKCKGCYEAAARIGKRKIEDGDSTGACSHPGP